MLMLIAALSLQASCSVTVIEGRVETPTAVHEALAIEGGVIAAVGAAGDMPEVPAGCTVVLPEDQTVFPGLTDAHVHLSGVGLRQMMLNLDDARSLSDLQAALARRAIAQPAGPIIGRGWIETGWPEGRPPNRQDIDDVVADRPVILTRADGHALVANTAALEASGITRRTRAPEGGRIVKDRSGRPNGYLIDAAMELVDGLVPPLTEDRRRDALRTGAQTYAALGWTSVHNMSVEEAELDLMAELAAAGELPLRVTNFVVQDAMDRVIAEGPGCDPTGLVCTLGVKFYADGALGSRGALLKEPYTDDPQTRGLRLMSRPDAMTAYRKAARAGLQITTHAIGDQANLDVLDWYAEIREEFPGATLRVEHAQIVDPEDLGRFADAGVIASMQPSHAIGDLHFADQRLGLERLKGAYAWNSLADEGTLIVFGSDAPVEKGDPRIELYAATTRRDLSGYSGEGWHPEEALTRAETLALFTITPELAIGRGGSLGTLAPGFAADLSIFRGDPFDGPDAARAVATVIGGQVVSGSLGD